MGYDMNVWCGPAHEELFAANVSGLASGMMKRRHGLACSLPLDLEFACMVMASHSAPNAYKDWQRWHLRILRKHLRGLHAFVEFYEPLRAAVALTTAATVSPGHIDLLNRSIAWPDFELPWMPTVGVNVINAIPQVGIVRESVKESGTCPRRNFWQMLMSGRFDRKETFLSHGKALARLLFSRGESSLRGGIYYVNLDNLKSRPVRLKAAVQALMLVVCSMQLCWLDSSGGSSCVP